MNGLAYQIELLQDALRQLNTHDGLPEPSAVCELQVTLAYTTALVQRAVTLQRQQAKPSRTHTTEGAEGNNVDKEGGDYGDVNENKRKQLLQSHEGKREETLASIAARFGTSLAILRQDNPHVRHLTPSDVLPANTILKLRPTSVTKTHSATAASAHRSPVVERVRGPTSNVVDLATPPPQQRNEGRKGTTTKKKTKEEEHEKVHAAAAAEVPATNAPSPRAHAHTNTNSTPGAVSYPYSTVNVSYRNTTNITTNAAVTLDTTSNLSSNNSLSNALNLTTASEESTSQRQTSLDGRSSPIALSDLLRGSMDSGATTPPPPSCAPAPLIPRYQLEMQGNPINLTGLDIPHNKQDTTTTTTTNIAVANKTAVLQAVDIVKGVEESDSRDTQLDKTLAEVAKSSETVPLSKSMQDELTAQSPLRASPSSASSPSAQNSPQSPPPRSRREVEGEKSATKRDIPVALGNNEEVVTPHARANTTPLSSIPRESSNPFTALSSPTVEDHSTHGSLARDNNNTTKEVSASKKKRSTSQVDVQVQRIKAAMRSGSRPSPSPPTQPQQVQLVASNTQALKTSIDQHSHDDDEETYSSNADEEEEDNIGDDENDEANVNAHVQRTLGGHFSSSAPPPTIQPRAITLNRVAAPMPSTNASKTTAIGSASGTNGAPRAARSLLNDTSELSLSQQSSSTFVSLHSSHLYSGLKTQESNTDNSVNDSSDNTESNNNNTSHITSNVPNTHQPAGKQISNTEEVVHESAAVTSDLSPDVKRPDRRPSPANANATLMRSMTTKSSTSRSRSGHRSRERRDDVDDDEEEEEYDTIMSIAQTYHVTPEVVLQWNSYLSVYRKDEPLPPDLPIVLPQVTPN